MTMYNDFKIKINVIFSIYRAIFLQSRGYFPFFIPSNNDYGYDKVKKELGKEVAYHFFFLAGK